jgi:hypothetical protein
MPDNSANPAPVLSSNEGNENEHQAKGPEEQSQEPEDQAKESKSQESGGDTAASVDTALNANASLLKLPSTKAHSYSSNGLPSRDSHSLSSR